MLALTLYTKEDCPLCQAAESRVAHILAEFPVEIVDILGNRELEDLYIFRIPVLVGNGVVLAEGCISQADLYRVRNNVLASASASARDEGE